jgi:tetratricopeptide (TPR) repeat protein
MKRRNFCFILVLLLILAPGSAFSREPVKPKSSNPEAQALIDKAWNVVAVDLTIQTADKAIAYLEEADKLDPDNPEILVALADECWQRGDLMPRKEKEDYEARNVYFSKGLEAADKALSLKETAGAHYWHCANLASSYESRSILSQARIFLDLDRHMGWIEENDVSYLYGGYARFWSEVTSRVPDALLRMVGTDPNEVYGQLENAIRIEPRYLLNYSYQAKFLHRMGDNEKALEALKKAIEADPDIFPQELAKNKHAQKMAREYWKDFTGKDYPAR